MLSFVAALPPPASSGSERYRSLPVSGSDDATLVIIQGPGDITAFRYSDGTHVDVHVRSAPLRIDAVIAPGQTLEDFAAYLYGPVLGFVLRTRGTLAMHASSVQTGDGAVLFAGITGAGKSTLAAALAARGHPVLSDDLTALTPENGQYMAHPAFDHIRLWQSSETLLFQKEHVLERITPSWDKLRLPLAAGRFASVPTRVRAVFVLDDDVGVGHVVREMRPVAALLSLTALTYANYLLSAEQRATELAQLGALVQSVSVRRLPNRGQSLDALCDLVERDLNAGRAAATAPV